MKCPNCGEEMKEGHLICEACGNEIRIVPDFEPEIENSITEALSTIAASQEEDTDGNAQNTSTGMIVSGTEVPAKKADPVRIHDEDALDRRDRSRMIGFVLTVVIVFMISACSYLLYEDRKSVV